MDKETRSAIERATQKARRLLEDEFAEQLAGDFDIMRDGAIGNDASGHLDQRQRVLRSTVLAAISHKCAAGMQAGQAVTDYLRDAAFTTLNRFVALKMLERRDLVQECISRGDASSGFNEFTSFAPGLKLPDGSGYRLYLESLFDEMSTEIKVLFDRRDPSGILWPRKLAFDGLLLLLNSTDLTFVWDQDETIGWVYQYFNSGDERRAMREASQAPRNSRELAVRNQFFTPSYIVQFLVDNTLGRIWYEMRQGDTSLARQCEYMVRNPQETFEENGEILVLEEPANILPENKMTLQPTKVYCRPKKDPRSLTVIDPACGSAHFLLGVFELLLTIYVEAWADPFCPAFELTGRTLRDEYPTQVSLNYALPGLILRHNLYGVDIDARCGQIAQLALWMRAQRAFADNGVARADRPPVVRSNIIIAEPMPGERDLLDGFLLSLKEDRLEAFLRRALKIAPSQRMYATKAMAESLSELIEGVWDGLRLAGEMGLLVRIELHLAAAIHRGRADWEEQLPLFKASEFGLGQHEDSSDIPFDFWTQAERIVLQALHEYASSAGTARRRLFAEDATQGFALADAAAKRFDVVLMNPPFGSGSVAAKASFDRAYPRTKNDVYAAFVERGIELLNTRGRLGALTSRTGFFLTSFQEWRESIILQEAPPVIIVDLGAGILDAAMVETAAYVLEKI